MAYYLTNGIHAVVYIGEMRGCVFIDSACWVICMFFVVCGYLFFRNTIRVSNSLDPDQARCFVGPDLDPNCLQRLSADDKSRH